MTNNDTFRRLRYIFDFNDDQLIKIFGLVDQNFDRSTILDWLKKDENEEDVKSMYDIHLANFLNGLIILKRGKREGPLPKPEKRLNNNLILRKIKIALALKDVDMVDIFNAADFEISKHEINAFFRKPDQKQYRLCKDQFLRNFLMGMQKVYRT